MANEFSDIPEGFDIERQFSDIPEGFDIVEPESRSIGQQVGRGVGLALRDVVEGPASLAGVVTNPIVAGINAISNVLGGPDLGTEDLHGSMSEFLSRLGVPEPETQAEQVVSRINQAVTAGGGSIAIGRGIATVAEPVARGVGTTLASNPALQGVSAATGSGSTEIAKEAGAGPAGQMAAGLAGAVIPGVAAAAGPGIVRRSFRGGETGRQRVAENIDTFKGAGTEPSVAQATEGRIARATEGLLSRSPGGAGPVTRRAISQADEVGLELERKALQLVGKKASAEQTGRQIQRAIKGEGGFIEKFRGTQKALYDNLDNFVPTDRPVKVDNSLRVLKELTKPVRGAEETTKRLVNKRIADIAEGLELDAKDGTIPYEALKSLRTRIGDELDNGLVNDVPAAQWKRIYGAMSEDMKSAADTPKALAAWRRADRFTKAGLERLESIQTVMRRKGGPEKIFQAATSGTKEGASTLRAVMQSVDDTGKRMISATVLRRLGLAKAGVQGDLGDRFSTETFLTNWNLLSGEAKRTLFNRYGKTFRHDMDRVASFASNLREGSAVFRNPSGTAQAQTQAATAGAFALSVLTGQAEVAGTIAGTVGGANLMGRLMTNPRFVRWLAQSTTIPQGTAPAFINQLAQQAKRAGDVDLAIAAELLQENQQQ